MPTNTRDDRSLERHTGADAILKFTIEDGEEETQYEVPVTNFSWTRDYTTEEVQHNGSLNPTLTTSEIRYNGSFEYEGQNPSVLTKLLQSQATGGSVNRNRPQRATITMKEYNHDDGDKVEMTVQFKRCLVTSNDRDITSGDVSNTSFDWEAEDMSITEGQMSDE